MNVCSEPAGPPLCDATATVELGLSCSTSPPCRSSVHSQRRWWSPDTIALVTGSNRGIGKAIAKLLASQGLIVIATARNEERGQQAVAELRTALGPGARIVFHPLDIADPLSHARFKAWLQKEYGGFTILINNGAVMYHKSILGSAEVRHTLSINYLGTAALTECLLPLMQSREGRVVSVSCRAGLISVLQSTELQHRFLKARNKEDIDTLMTEYVALVDKGDEEALLAAGWPKSMYAVSKLALTTYSRVLAQLRGIQTAACCPGRVRTEMSRMKGDKSPEEGADTPVWLALQGPNCVPTGRLWAERSVCDP